MRKIIAVTLGALLVWFVWVCARAVTPPLQMVPYAVIGTNTIVPWNTPVPQSTFPPQITPPPYFTAVPQNTFPTGLIAYPNLSQTPTAVPTSITPVSVVPVSTWYLGVFTATNTPTGTLTPALVANVVPQYTFVPQFTQIPVSAAFTQIPVNAWPTQAPQFTFPPQFVALPCLSVTPTPIVAPAQFTQVFPYPTDQIVHFTAAQPMSLTNPVAQFTQAVPAAQFTQIVPAVQFTQVFPYPTAQISTLGAGTALAGYFGPYAISGNKATSATGMSVTLINTAQYPMKSWSVGITTIGGTGAVTAAVYLAVNKTYSAFISVGAVSMTGGASAVTSVTGVSTWPFMDAGVSILGTAASTTITTYLLGMQ